MFVSFRNEPKYACRAINQSPPRDGWRGGPSIGSRKYGILYKWEREREAGRNGNVKNSIIYTNWNILKSIRKCGDAWRMTRGIGSFKSHRYSHHHHHHRSHRSTQLRLHCLSKRHKWSAARLSAAIGGGLSLFLSGCFPPWMTMSMTNHGQHVKNLSWNIWAVNLAGAPDASQVEEQFLSEVEFVSKISSQILLQMCWVQTTGN